MIRPTCSKVQALEWASGLKDAMGKGLDPGIVSSVAGMHLMGIRTQQSCQGHAEWGLPFPWIDIHHEDLERCQSLLAKYPLPGWLIMIILTAKPNACRLVPEPATLGVNKPAAPLAELMGEKPDSPVYHRLTSLLPMHQAQIELWGKGLLEAS